jgi:hypothetical protein
MKVFLTVITLLLLGATSVLLMRSTHRDLALSECIEDISNKCSSLFNYAISLEEENSRLNSQLRNCIDENR